MKSIGEKIKNLRIAAGLSQEQLAEKIAVTATSIYRYEVGSSSPDSYVLARLAVFFDISVDYLLGLMGYEEQLKEESLRLSPNGECNCLYARYLHCKHDYTIDPDAEYYFIEWGNNLEDISAHTQWIGFDEKMKHELRRIAPVDPIEYLTLHKRLCHTFVVINDEEDVYAFSQFRGQALIKADICEKYLPSFCRNFIVPLKNY